MSEILPRPASRLRSNFGCRRCFVNSPIHFLHELPNCSSVIAGSLATFERKLLPISYMASLVGLEPFGIRVDFPDEPRTGGDMEWIYAAPLEVNGGRYLRLLLQAKRAHFVKLKSGGYWYYHHLDHGSPAGDQAQKLVAQASLPGGKALRCRSTSSIILLRRSRQSPEAGRQLRE